MREKIIYALGFFDGVHLGHAALLRACRTLAGDLPARAGVVTFENHPDALVLHRTPKLICTASERERLLREEFHMDAVVSLPFDERMRAMPWQDFLELLLRDYDAAGFVCGEDFRFGDRGAGSAAILAEECRVRRLPCAVVPQLKRGGEAISSTRIRALLEQGDAEQAAALLGRPFSLYGTVVHGRHLGTALGVPTANLTIPPELVCPRHGVYACRVLVDGVRYDAVTNIGTRPTVSGDGVTVESWLFGYAGDLYGKPLRLEVCRFLRPERKFPDTEALQRGIRADAEQARAYFAGLPAAQGGDENENSGN